MAGNQSLGRGLDILDLLDKSSKPLGVREIARQLDLGVATVQRLINTLAARNYIAQDTETRRYAIGYRAFGLGWSLTRNDRLISIAKPELDALASEHLLNCYLGVRRGTRVIYALSVQSEGPIAIRSAPGATAYLHSTALGRVTLAGLSDDEAMRLLSAEPLVQVTPQTQTDPAALLAAVGEVRRTGVSIVRDENIQGIVSVGAPVRDASGDVVAAISTAFAEWATPDTSVEKVVDLVTASAARISKFLGY